MQAESLTLQRASRLTRIKISMTPREWRRAGAMAATIAGLHIVGFGILILVASMCAIAFSALSAAEWLVVLILAMFVAGILAVLLSVVLIALEVRTSHRAVAFEVQRVLRFAGDPAPVTWATARETVKS